MQKTKSPGHPVRIEHSVVVLANKTTMIIFTYRQGLLSQPVGYPE